MKDRLAVSDTGTPGMLAGRRVLRFAGAGLSLVAVCYGLARFAYGLFVPVFRAEFGLDAATAGAMAAGSYVSYCVAIIASTILTPRFGGRALAVTAGCVATGGTLMVAAAPNAGLLATGVILAGASTGVASPPLAHAVAHFVTAPRRNRAQSVINAGTGVGVVISGPIAMLTQEQWRAAWLVFAVLCLLVTVWVARAVPAGSASRVADGPSLKLLLPQPLLPAGCGRLMLSAALMGVASTAVWTFGRDLLVAEGDMTAQASTIAWILLGVFGVLGATAGDIIERVGIRTGWRATMFVLAMATGLLAVFPDRAIIAAAATGIFGAAYIALTGLLLIWGTRVYSQSPAAGVGMAFLAIALGQAGGAPVIGALSGVVGARSAFAAAAALAVVGSFVGPRRTRGSLRSPGGMSLQA